jgi:DNA modification methylase
MIALVNATANRIPMPDESVHCVATSPPYKGLRDYGLPPRIWDGEEGCKHVWGDELIQHQRGQVGENSTLDGGLQAGGDGRLEEARQGQFCQLCGAWRGCLGLEPTIELYVSHLVAVFREVRRVLHPSGVVWLNLGDSYAGGQVAGSEKAFKGKQGTNRGSLGMIGKAIIPNGLKPKDLCMIPARVALALQADGWWLRSEITWCKTAPMPESVTDRPTSATEKIYLFSKSPRYFYDQEAERVALVRPEELTRKTPAVFGGRNKSKGYGTRKHSGNEYTSAPTGGRNLWNYWSIGPEPFSGAHFAVFPSELPRRCISLGTSERGVCPECFAPWERVIDKSVAFESGSGKAGNQPKGKYNRTEQAESGEYDIRMGPVISSNTTGWRPTCDHDHEPIPATILDPFVGSGTTLQVARQLGRRGIGLDLSYDYLHDQARERLGLTAWDAWHEGGNGKEGEPLEALPLFEGLPADA